MRSEERAVRLKERIERIENTTVVQRLWWVGPIIPMLALIPDNLKPDWLDYIYLAVLISISVGALYHRFVLSGLGLLIMSGGAMLSIWYTTTGTPRPPSDHITGLVLLSGLILVGVELLVCSITIRRLDRRSLLPPDASSGG